MQLKTSYPENYLVLASFQALSDPIRLKVIELLRYHELCVCDICEILDIKQPKLSFHLKILKEANLILARQEGRWIYYRLNLTQFTFLENYLSQFKHLKPITTTKLCQ